MSKHDYERIAAILAQYRGWQWTATADSMAAAISLDLAEAFAASNPRFDREKWFRAVQKHI